jgi:rhamnose utilization protein RhaD (predicted bifunctional aldolase and dehydrogenase)
MRFNHIDERFSGTIASQRNFHHNFLFDISFSASLYGADQIDCPRSPVFKTSEADMSALADLKILSAKLGADPLLVQAAGGNTSLKQNGKLWIKASGTWLKDATSKDIFVALDHLKILQALADGHTDAETCAAFVLPESLALGLRPSIETTVHATMPQSVVLHVHCVNTIAHAIRNDAAEILRQRLGAFAYAFVPYARPGLPLAASIASVMRKGVEVLVLQNHGLVVAAETVAAANLLDRVVAALTITPRAAPLPNLPALAATLANSEYTVANDPFIHAIALDPCTRDQGATAVYYPDHVIFLGTHIAISLAEAAPIVAIPGQGVAIHKTAKPAAIAMARCLADVFLRVVPGTSLKALTPEELHRLTNWDAEKYRQKLDFKPPG